MKFNVIIINLGISQNVTLKKSWQTPKNELSAPTLSHNVQDILLTAPFLQKKKNLHTQPISVSPSSSSWSSCERSHFSPERASTFSCVSLKISLFTPLIRAAGEAEESLVGVTLSRAHTHCQPLALFRLFHTSPNSLLAQLCVALARSSFFLASDPKPLDCCCGLQMHYSGKLFTSQRF
jgi:hypothetical protein